jgi:Heavy metal associated domain 2
MSAVSRSDGEAEAPRALGIVHNIPGRLRLRLPPGAGAAGLTDVLDRLPGAQSTVWSPRTRSLLVHYDPAVLSAADIAGAVAEYTDLLLHDELPGVAASGGRPPVATALSDALGGINARVTRRTKGRLDLPLLLSVGLLFWAARQLLRGPVTALSWTSALWYAHGLFRDYHGPFRDR